MTIAQRIAALIRTSRLSAEHEAVCPIEGTCAKCEQLLADQETARIELLATLGLTP